ncbi:cell division protein FtsL [Roseobacter sp. HKCCD9010]|uniref:cell division protein FtsL n=1 Tax=unclassified Roseobacter TaxID=196798 RepID=UPI0014921E9B|nr:MULTISPECIES: cell division protein FtsL [unclassified Roseobacter]MBF9049516.1 cell division protein FtsL [Rhodobacterales bacterium HKCCD4356]NNV11516.1 cell division protein FtsL [Roseobacter sp. HKCCD7357]NNV15700.1 cell division protein FtsL [Roseobacter sp. HKCCD8768]NNV25160.1 cell division protein FtsL [Roseobacter sp. HKCCD8192]NNV29417.1 cell division protein FtsL [Roseobacter sp. HKCCD9061]
MRGFASLLAALAVIGLGYWAYHQNILTQHSIREVEQLQRQIGVERERLSVLRAEWAYLNRPDRLRELADLNFERLGLMPMTPEHFGDVHQVVYPTLLDQLIDEALIDSASSPEMLP